MTKWKNHNLMVWGPLLEEATKAVKASKTPINLWQLHHQIQNKEMGGPAVYKYSPWNPVFPTTGTEEVMGEATWNHVKVSQAHQILLGGKVVYVPPPILLDIKRLMFTELSKAITADTEVVVETGSGWSRNIFYLTETGLLRNKNIRVYSGEFSVSARMQVAILVHWKSNAVWNRVANGFVYVKYIKLREPTSQDFPTFSGSYLHFQSHLVERWFFISVVPYKSRLSLIVAMICLKSILLDAIRDPSPTVPPVAIGAACAENLLARHAVARRLRRRASAGSRSPALAHSRHRELCLDRVASIAPSSCSTVCADRCKVCTKLGR